MPLFVVNLLRLLQLQALVSHPHITLLAACQPCWSSHTIIHAQPPKP